jgi:hypothetical protein
MSANGIPHLLVEALAAIFAFAAIIDVVGARYIRARFRQWRYPSRFYRVMGMLQLFAAFFLAAPASRIWGVVLAGFILFLWIVILLNHRRWSWAAGGMVVMMALVPASLAVH